MNSELKPKNERNAIKRININQLISLQSHVRGFLQRKNMKENKGFPSQTFIEDAQKINTSNNTLNVTDNNEAINQSAIITQNHNLFSGHLENNIALMNFNPSVSRTIENRNDGILDEHYLNENFVSNIQYLLYIIIF